MLTQLHLTDGRSYIVTSRSPTDIANELEDTGAFWLEVTTLECDGRHDRAEDWYTRTHVFQHGAIREVGQISPSDRRAIPECVIARHEATT